MQSVCRIPDHSGFIIFPVVFCNEKSAFIVFLQVEQFFFRYFSLFGKILPAVCRISCHQLDSFVIIAGQQSFLCLLVIIDVFVVFCCGLVCFFVFVFQLFQRFSRRFCGLLQTPPGGPFKTPTRRRRRKLIGISQLIIFQFLFSFRNCLLLRLDLCVQNL